MFRIGGDELVVLCTGISEKEFYQKVVVTGILKSEKGRAADKALTERSPRPVPALPQHLFTFRALPLPADESPHHPEILPCGAGCSRWLR